MREETPRPVILYVEGGMFMGKEIVFCKDCKYWSENKTTKGSYRNCIFSKTMMYADGFCSRGERRGEEDERNM